MRRAHAFLVGCIAAVIGCGEAGPPPEQLAEDEFNAAYCDQVDCSSGNP